MVSRQPFLSSNTLFNPKTRFAVLSNVAMSLLRVSLGPADHKAAMLALRPDLAYLLTNSGVPEDVQGMIAHLGYPSIDVFSKVEDSKILVRGWVKTDVGVDAALSPAHRACVAQVLTAWEASTMRLATTQKHEAEARVPGQVMAREIPRGSYMELTRSYDKKINRELKDSEKPAKAYIEARFEQVEEGEFRAELMSDVLSREDEDSEGQAPQVVTTTDGSLRMKKGKVKGELPRTPEDLRTKIRLMAVHWGW